MWKFFLGACVLTAAMLQPHAPARAIVRGMGLAALLLGAWRIATSNWMSDRDIDRSDRGQNDSD